MTKKTIRKIRRFLDTWDFLFLGLFIITSRWIPWMMWPAAILLILSMLVRWRVIPDFRQSSIYIAMKGGERWRRFKGIHRQQIFVDRVILVLFLALLAFIIIGVNIRGAGSE